MLRVLLVISSIALAASASTVRADESYDFHGLKLGTPLNEIEGHGRWQCVYPRLGPVGCKHDGTTDDAVGGLVPTDIWVIFRGGRLASIGVFFAHIDIKTVIDALKKQYGQPVEEGPYTDFSGYRAFENYRVVWRNATSKITVIKRLGARIDESAIHYEFSDMLRRSVPRRDAGKI